MKIPILNIYYLLCYAWDRLEEGETISVSIGQGPVLVTPLQMSTMMAAVANGGFRAIPRVAKLASATDINSLLAAATSGVELQATMKPPAQIPTKAGMTYFTVRTDSDYWRNLLVERRIAMYIPTPFTPTDTHVELFGIIS